MPYLGSQPSTSLATTASLGDDIVTLAKLAGGTDGNVISFDASGDPVAIATGSDGQVLTSSGAGAVCAFETVSAGFTQAATVASTSGTAHTFGSIPAGVKMIVLSFFNVSYSGGADAIRVTLGDSGGLETAGYISMRAQLRSSANILFDDTAFFEVSDELSVASQFRGSAIFTLQDADTFRWICQWQCMDTSNLATVNVGAGSKALSAELTQLSVAGGTFDLGSLSIMYQ